MKNWFKVFSFFFMLGLLVYFNSLNNKFLMDDYTFLNNPALSSTKFISSQWNPYGEQALGVMDKQVTGFYYRPMTHILYDFCYDTFKNNFWQYHLLNLFLLTFAASLIYLLIGRLSGNYHLSFLTGLFYLIHPINGIVVNYISASVFALEVIFILATILLLWESLERKNDRALYLLSLLASFLSLFWHESGVMTPFYVLAVVLLFRDDPYKRKAIYLFPYFLIIFLYLIFRSCFFGINGSVLKQVDIFHITGWEYLASLFQVLAWYISKLFYPQGIVMQWATPILHDHIIWNVLGICLLLMIFLWLFVRCAKEKILQMGIVWFLIGFIPVCLAAFRRPENGVQIEPHWFIFSSIGFFILASYFCLIILNRTKIGGLALLFIVILSWSAASHAYNQVWADQKTYARFWSQQAPNLKVAYFYLAVAYQKEKDFNDSMKYYRLALNGYTSDSDIYVNMGLMDEANSNWKEAELNFRKVLKINPLSAVAYHNLGVIYLKNGQWEKAKKYFLQALVYDTLMIESRGSLAFILASHSEYQKAIDLCLKNLDIVNDDTETLFLLVDIYIHQRDLVNTRKYAYRIINFKNDPEILTRLGVKMAAMNINDVAIDCYIKALRVAPDYKDAYFESGKLLENLGKYGEAIHIWKFGLRVAPFDQRFRMSIAKAIKLELK